MILAAKGLEWLFPGLSGAPDSRESVPPV
jgi:hypothetical protein